MLGFSQLSLSILKGRGVTRCEISVISLIWIVQTFLCRFHGEPAQGGGAIEFWAGPREVGGAQGSPQEALPAGNRRRPAPIPPSSPLAASDAQLPGLFVTANDFPLSIFSPLRIFTALSPRLSSPACEEASLSVRGTSECILGPGLFWMSRQETLPLFPPPALHIRILQIRGPEIPFPSPASGSSRRQTTGQRPQSPLHLPVVIQWLSRVQLFEIPSTAALQASLSSTVSQSLLKLMSMESVMPSNHLVLCLPLLLFLCRRPKQKLKISTSSQPKDTGRAFKSPSTRQIIWVSTLEAGLVSGGIFWRETSSFWSLPS